MSDEVFQDRVFSTNPAFDAAVAVAEIHAAHARLRGKWDELRMRLSNFPGA